MHVPRHTHSYRWWLFIAVLVAFGTALGACRSEDTVYSDADRGNGNPSSAPTTSVDPNPSYYEADVRVVFYGGFRPDAVREYSYHIEQTLRDGAWSLALTHPDQGASLGSDIARLTISGPGNVTVSTRAGKPAALPDLATVLAGMRQAHPNQPWDPNRKVSFRAVDATPVVGASLGAGTQGGPLMHDVVGSAGRERLLSRFQSREYTEQSAPSGRRRFERAKGTRAITVELDAVTGAAVREEVHEGGRLVTTTNREYRQVGPLALLEREITTRFDAAGAPGERFERRLTNIRTERSR